ncbi:MAG: tRNA (N(6)-L-threonylcarbamoyladenosine(37)-C(2))-methylthiotransferase MtaB [Bacteroidetes bacterium]|nr:MAG: tRNA (N(6)-L-threonylcarbamoyladenosine(37)-C(2))-methylthiotransferase MtaB [Bacteroidota bacterium]
MQKGATVAYHTLGCKLNFAETSTLARDLDKAGFDKVEFNDMPDVFVINTCSVTENANRKCRQVVNRARRISPDAIIAVTGCFAQLKPEEIADIPGVDMVLGAADKFKLTEHLLNYKKNGAAKIYSCEIDHVNEFIPSHSKGDRTRAFLKAQDGCDYSCSFCTIPLARGSSRSDTIKNLVTSARQLGLDGIKEIVLTGINIGDFGKNNGFDHAEHFIDLIRELDSVDDVDRFRISSIEPNLLNDEIIKFVSESKRFMPHFHIPLQSGSNRILKLMKRRYLKELYADRVKRIKQLMPHCCIGVDVIVGFPGETEEDFMETYNFVRGLGVSYLHVFSYSERANTLASEMNKAVPKAVRLERSKMLQVLSIKLKRAFYKNHINESMNVLFESEQSSGMIHGFSENYIKVSTPFDPLLINKVMEVHPTKFDSEGNLFDQNNIVAAESVLETVTLPMHN